MWWGEGRCGYTSDSTKAGLYDRDEAASVVFNVLPGQNVAVDTIMAERFAGAPYQQIEEEIASWRSL